MILIALPSVEIYINAQNISQKYYLPVIDNNLLITELIEYLDEINYVLPCSLVHDKSCVAPCQSNQA
jgi:hypothetical protein